MVECGVTYFGVRRLQHAQVDLENIAKHGATYVIHTLSENDWHLYFDTMHKIIQATQQMGMKTWLDPWSVGYVFGADDDALFPLANPEACQVDQYGRITPCACLNQPLFRNFVKSWIDAAVDLGVDMLFWDEPHFYWWEWFSGKFYKQPEGRWGCRCPLCMALYKERFGETMPTEAADPGVIEFKALSQISFLSELFTYAGSKGAHNAVCILPFEFDSQTFAMLEEVAKISSLDNLGTDPYPFAWFDDPQKYGERWREYVGGYMDKLVKICQKYNKANHFWIQGFSVPENDHGYMDTVMDMAVEKGIKNLAVWGFDGHRDMSAFACEQPDKVWEQIGQGFKRIQTLK